MPAAIRAVLLFTTIAAVSALGGASAAAGPSPSRAPATVRVVQQAQNATLDKTVLTNMQGRTLYSLSVEKHGKFICTGSCLSVWHPLLVPAGAKPKGPVKLGTIVRPDNDKTQVTFEGRPLYRFGGDTKAGEVNGEGIKDVGTWHAAGRSQPTPQPSPQPEPPYPGSY